MFLTPWRNKTRDINRVDPFQEFVNQFFTNSGRDWFEGGTMSPTNWTPAIDVVEKNDEINITADLPGLSKDDIKVSVENNVLTIQGERKYEHEENKDGVWRSERTYGSFHRSLQLPQTVDAQKINAAYKNGVLSLTLKKRADAQPKQIDIDIN